MMTILKSLLEEERFDFISTSDKVFVSGFDEEMNRLGFGFGGKIGVGYCWGRYMLIYRKSNVKSQNVFARIYLREKGIVLRLFLNDIDKHRNFIEQSPAHIKQVFTGEHGKCQHCHNEKEGMCRFRKEYTIDGIFTEKCNGITFEFPSPKVEQLQDYIALFTEFFPGKKRNLAE
jgi:hypothetical protein